MLVCVVFLGCSSAPKQKSIAFNEDLNGQDLSKIAHPKNFEIETLKQFFKLESTPRGLLGEFADMCDEDFKRSMASDGTARELKDLAHEFVKTNPVKMHWCFYSKLVRLDEVLTGDSSWAERQNAALKAYEFLSPVANAFNKIHQESRYKKWTNHYYSKINDWVLKKTPNSNLKSNRAPASTKSDPLD
jgi:hypothetical protein